MLTSPFSFSPTPADLKDLLISCSKHSLHTNFRRGMEEPWTGNDSINVGFRCRGRQTRGGFHFQITPMGKKIPDLL
jgi:hypothetical protein